MPRPIDDRSLAAISGSAQFNTTTQLLDNTLATMSHKMKQREQAQLSQLRAMEMQQTGNEMLEYQKQAYARDLQRQLLEKETKDTIDNYDYNAEMAARQSENEMVASDLEARNASLDYVLSSPNDKAFKANVAQYREFLPVEVAAQLENVNWDNPTERKRVSSQISQDREHIQRMEQIRLQEQLKASGSSGGTPKMTTTPAQISSYLEKKPGLGGKGYTDGLTQIAFAVRDQVYNDTRNVIDAISIADIMADLIYEYPDKYETQSGNFFSSKTPNVRLLKQDVLNSLYGVEAKQSPAVAAGINEDVWNSIRNNPENAQFSDEALIEAIRNR